MMVKQHLLFFLLIGSSKILLGQSSQICFHAQNSINTLAVGQAPKSLTSADFNSDGIPDIATANYNSGNVSLLLSSGVGSYTTAVIIPAGMQPSGIISEDFNNDGKADLALTNYGAGNISVLLGSGNGTFSSLTSYTTTVGPLGITTADFDNDGKIDIVVTNSGAGNFSFFKGTGFGTFNSPVYFAVGTNPYAIIASDFNSDGNLDVAVSNAGSNNVSVRLGNGQGSFGPVANYSVGNSPKSLISADFDGDTNLDLAVANYSSNYTTNNVTILMGTGAGNFSVTTNFTTTSTITLMLFSPAALASSDYNNDGKPDLAVLYSGSDCVSISLGTGLGTFSSSVAYATSSTPNCIINADINSDGKTDLITANISSNNVSVLYGSGSGIFCSSVSVKTQGGPVQSACGDFNEDGYLDVAVANLGSAAISIYCGTGTGKMIRTYGFQTGGLAGPASIIAADFNNDSHLDIAVTEYAGAPYIDIYDGHGYGTFSGPLILWAGGTDPIDVISTDFNNDGVPDLACCNFNSNNFSILSGSLTSYGYNIFSMPVTFNVGSQPRAIIATDLNGDGTQDVVVVNSGANSISVLLGGSGSFTTSFGLPVGNTPYSVKSGDLNSDGFKDLVVANYASNNVTVLLGTGTGSFASAINYNVNVHPRTLSLADFNNDGFLDIVVPNEGSDNVSFLQGNGFGTFSSIINYNVGSHPYSTSVGDFNNDGRPDVAVANYYSDNLGILLNGIPNLTIIGLKGICLGNSITLQANGASFYNWSTGANTNTISVSPLSATIYTVNATSFGYCLGHATKSVAVTSNFSISAPNGSICSGQLFTLSANGANTYTFSGGSPIVSPTLTTSYSVTGTNSLDCAASNTVVINLAVLPLPTITIVGNNAICKGSSITQLVNGTAITYTWSSGTTGHVVYLTPTVSTNYVVTGTDVNGCKNSTNKLIVVNPLPNVYLTSSSNLICEGEFVTLNATGSSFYNWNNGSNNSYIVVNPTTSTSYSVNGTDTNGCTNSATIIINVDACTANVNFPKKDSNYKVFPNPSKDVIVIESDFLPGLKTAEIFNSFGQKVNLSIFELDSFSIDINDFPIGVYFLHVSKDGNILLTEKIIKM
jgi:hypothetical protein